MLHSLCFISKHIHGDIRSHVFEVAALKLSNCCTLWRHAWKICNCARTIKFAPPSCNKHTAPLWQNYNSKYEQVSGVKNILTCNLLTQIWMVHANKYENGKGTNTIHLIMLRLTSFHTNMDGSCKQIRKEKRDKYKLCTSSCWGGTFCSFLPPLLPPAGECTQC